MEEETGDKSTGIMRSIGALVFTLLNSIFQKMGMILLVGIVLYNIDVTEMVVAFAGEETIQDISLYVDTDIGLTEAVKELNKSLIIGSLLLLFVCVVVIIWAIAERKLRQKTVANLGDRNSKLEKFIDDNKGSSRLTKHGSTNKDDLL